MDYVPAGCSKCFNTTKTGLIMNLQYITDQKGNTNAVMMPISE
jgi:hypothetical protein